MSGVPAAGGSAASARVQLSAEEVKAQRAAKKAEKQKLIALAQEKKARDEGESGKGAAAAWTPKQKGQPAAPSSDAASGQPTPTGASGKSHQPRKPASSPAHTPSHASLGSGAAPPTLALDRAASSITPRNKEATQVTKRHQPMMQFDDPKKVASFNKAAMVQRTAVAKQVPLFSHLPQYEHEASLSLKLKVGFSSEEIHPAILRLGLQFASGTITGANARCVGMLTAFSHFIADYRTPASKVMRDDLLSKLKPLVRFLIDARPLSVSCGNAIRYLKMRISKLDPTMSEARAKEQLLSDIGLFLTKRIEIADEVIATHGCSKINDGDVILTFASSHVVELLLKRAHSEGRKFRLIIVDSRPKLEGKALLKRLVSCGLACTYIMINALPCVMKEVTKVFLGAAAMLANGGVIARLGTAIVAMTAHLNNVPVLVCCETYKFHERVQLDSIGFNELADPDELILTDSDQMAGSPSSLTDWRDLPHLKLLNLVYDLTPQTFITMVISECGMVPATSVPVLLREYSVETADVFDN